MPTLFTVLMSSLLFFTFYVVTLNVHILGENVTDFIIRTQQFIITHTFEELIFICAISFKYVAFLLIQAFFMLGCFHVAVVVVWGLGSHLTCEMRWRYYISVVVSYANWVKQNNTLLRSTFNDTPLVRVKAVQDHTHGQSAANRSSASNTAELIARLVGLTPFYMQKSASDVRANRQGWRTWYWAKDFIVKPSLEAQPDHPFMVCVDVDYYLNLPSMLAMNPVPYCLYTMQPSDVAAVRDEYSYTFDKDGMLHYSVSGGGTYVHPIWNFGTDSITVTKEFLGFRYACASYLVDKKHVDVDHELVMLTPTAAWYGLPALISTLFYGRTLTRANPVVGEHLRMEYQTKTGHLVSTGRVGQYGSVTIPSPLDQSIADHAVSLTREIAIAQIEHLLGLPILDPAKRKSEAAILRRYHIDHSEHAPPKLFPVVEGVRRYQFGNLEPEAKPSLQAFMTPLIDASFAPDRTRQNEEQAVVGRVIKTKSSPELTPFLTRCMSEFAEHMFPAAGILIPMDYDAVYDRQARPSQRTLLQQAIGLLPNRVVKSFLKAESYDNPKDPRIISTINTVDKVEYSKFTYALSEYMKEMRWYAFGKKPVEIASRVVEVALYAETLIESDFERFDGSINPVLRLFERMILVRAFHPVYAPTISAAHGSQINLPAKTTQGVSYDTGFSRLSGSPETAVMNTLCNIFAAYVAFRKTKANGKFMNADDAWSAVNNCVVGGDDGLLRNVRTDQYVAACTELGLKVKADAKTPGQPVKFLARIYNPNVWAGDANSVCDMARQLSKLHTCVVLPEGIPHAHKLVEKCRGLDMSDRYTPIIGTFASRVVDLSWRVVTNIELRLVVNYSSLDQTTGQLHLRCDQYPNYGGEWAWDVLREQLPGIDVKRFNDWIADVRTLDECLTPPLLLDRAPPKVKTTTVNVDEMRYEGDPIEPLPKAVVLEHEQPELPRPVITVTEREPGLTGKKRKVERAARFARARSERTAAVAEASASSAPDDDDASPSRPNTNQVATLPKGAGRARRG